MAEQQQPQVVFERLHQMGCIQCGCRMDVAEVPAFAVIECPECGNQDTVPAKFGPFLILNLINTGGMGGVYRARDESLGRLVAIKVLLEAVGADRAFLENFKKEAQAAARLNHPNVAQIYSFGEERGQPYIVMELVSGQRFDRLIEKQERLDPALVLKIGVEIAEGLKAADAIGLIHGDIKPENILLDEKRNAKLVDFGVASFVGQQHDCGAGIWGTPYYIAPEKVQRRVVDARADIYSLGATLYHALAGRPPFEGKTSTDVVKARLGHMPKPLDAVRKDLPKGVSDMIQRMMQTEPALRYPTYASLISDLRRHLKDLGGEAGLLKGGDGRKILVRKPGAEGAMAATGPVPVAADPLPEAAKLRMAMPPASTRQGRSLHAGTRVVVRPKSRVLARVDVAGPGGEAAAGAPVPRKKSRAWIPLLIVGVLLLLSGGGFLGYHWQQKRKAARLEQYRQLAISQQVRLAGEAFDRVQRAAGQLSRTAAPMDAIVEEALAIVAFVEGRPLESFKKGAPPERPAGGDPKPAADAGGVPAPGAGAVDEDGRDAPFGMLSRDEDAKRVEATQKAVPGVDAKERERILRETEEAKAAVAASAGVDEEGREAPIGMGALPKKTQPAPEAPATADVAAPADAVAKAPEAGAGEDVPVEALAKPATFKSNVEKEYTGPEVVLLAAKVLGRKELLDFQLERGSVVVAEAEALRVKVGEMLEPSGAVSMVAAIEAKTGDVGKIVRGMQDLLVDANKHLVALKRIRRETEQERVRVAEAQEAQRLAEEQQRLVATEVAAAAQLAQEGKDAVLTWKPETALAAVIGAMDALQTEEGKAAHETVRDRYRRMIELQAFVIESINAAPWSWGWQHPGGAREDIVGADAGGIMLRSRRTVPWTGMTPQRYLRFVDRYITRPELTPSVRADHLVGAALLAREHGLRVESDGYRDKAIATSRHIAPEVARLLE